MGPTRNSDQSKSSKNANQTSTASSSQADDSIDLFSAESGFRSSCTADLTLDSSQTTSKSVYEIETESETNKDTTSVEQEIEEENQSLVAASEQEIQPSEEPIPSITMSKNFLMQQALKVSELKEGNYVDWSDAVKLSLDILNLDDLITKAHDDATKAKDGYALRNKSARAQLLYTMSDVMRMKVKHLETAWEIWEYMDKHFLGTSMDRLARLFDRISVPTSTCLRIKACNTSELR